MKKNSKSASTNKNEDDRSLNLEGLGCFSQGDSNASLKPNGGALKDPAPPSLLRKSRATKGPATDPQSLYARVSHPLEAHFNEITMTIAHV